MNLELFYTAMLIHNWVYSIASLQTHNYELQTANIPARWKLQNTKKYA